MVKNAQLLYIIGRQIGRPYAKETYGTTFPKLVEKAAGGFVNGIGSVFRRQQAGLVGYRLKGAVLDLNADCAGKYMMLP